MAELILESTSTAQWHRLVTEASAFTGARLDEDTECYLVFLLMRYLRRPDLLRRVMARGYLRAMLAEGQVRRQRLRDVGDQCLILAGMFPGQARRRRVDLKYFIDLGRGAYGRLGQMPESAAGELYGELAEAFTELMDVLHALRTTDRRGDMALLDAVERYWDTGSPAARRQLERSGRIMPMPQQDRRH